MRTTDSAHIPPALRARFDEIAARTDAIAATHLDADYAALCRRMAGDLARMRPSPLARGEARTWAAGIVHAVGWVNFLTDPSQQPHMTAAELAAATGVGQSTIAATFRTIREALDLVRLDPAWTRPGKLLDNPLAWMVLVDDLPIDLRDAPREIQEEAFRQGLIPFVPGPTAHDRETVAVEPGVRDPRSLPPGTTAGVRNAMAEAERVLQETLAGHPDASVDELNARLGAATAHYNHRAQDELGGLSPVAVHQLLDADWQARTAPSGCTTSPSRRRSSRRARSTTRASSSRCSGSAAG